MSVVTVDQQGRITFAANATPSIANTQITGTITNSQLSGSITYDKISTLSSSLVTNALGFTPYNATNPSGYQTTSGSVASATNATTATNATNILGSSQTYGDYIGSRSINTTYTNSTGKPIWVAVAWTATGNGDYSATVNGALAYFSRQDLYPRANVDFVVPIGGTYSVSNTAGQSPAYWYELRG